MLENYSMQELQELGGREVLDANGKSAGFVDLVFVDDPTGRPEWMGIWSGLPGKGPAWHRARRRRDSRFVDEGRDHERSELRRRGRPRSAP
jgi:hypothetical protein